MNKMDCDALYLSAHLDDAVYSCGARMYTQHQAGQRVRVATFFAASPADEMLTAFTRELKERWGGQDDIVAVRRAEDLAATAILGAQAQHLPFADCVYRQGGLNHEPLYPTVEHIFADLHPAESGLAAELQQALGPMGSATIYAPLGAGHHVDHLLVRRVALRLQHQGARVLFYEDYPYAGSRDVVAAALAPFAESCSVPESLFFGAAAFEAKSRAVACYRSQISTFWSGEQELRQALQAQAESAAQAACGTGYAERCWRIPDGCVPPALLG